MRIIPRPLYSRRPCPPQVLGRPFQEPYRAGPEHCEAFSNEKLKLPKPVVYFHLLKCMCHVLGPIAVLSSLLVSRGLHSRDPVELEVQEYAKPWARVTKASPKSWGILPVQTAFFSWAHTCSLESSLCIHTPPPRK